MKEPYSPGLDRLFFLSFFPKFPDVRFFNLVRFRRVERVVLGKILLSFLLRFEFFFVLSGGSDGWRVFLVTGRQSV